MFKRLRDIREDRDLTQRDIAELLQTTQQTYALWEQGKRELPIRHLITLCKFYDVSADYLLGLSDDLKRRRG